MLSPCRRFNRYYHSLKTNTENKFQITSAYISTHLLAQDISTTPHANYIKARCRYNVIRSLWRQARLRSAKRKLLGMSAVVACSTLLLSSWTNSKPISQRRRRSVSQLHQRSGSMLVKSVHLRDCSFLLQRGGRIVSNSIQCLLSISTFSLIYFRQIVLCLINATILETVSRYSSLPSNSR